MRYTILLAALFIVSACQNTKQKASVEKNHDRASLETMSHEEAMKLVEVKEHNVETIGILVYEGVNDLDALGPRYVFKNIMGVDVKTIAIDSGNIKTVMGLEFVPDTTIDQVKKLDILVIPGGFKQT